MESKFLSLNVSRGSSDMYRVALRGIIGHPKLTLVGVHVYAQEKVPGIRATTDLPQVIATLG
jgi:hypothetical protein